MIPVYINNWNILTWVKDMTRYLEKVPDVAIIIIDNNSTYQPLLDWYKTCDYDVMYLPVNEGSHAGYYALPKGSKHKNLFGSDYFIFTDADLDLSGCPTDLVEVLKYGFEKYSEGRKSGLSIEINDVPHDTLTPNGPAWEAGYWKHRLSDLFWDANVDTTFALYHKDAIHFGIGSIRSDRPYTARHLPWYFTENTRFSDEEVYMYSQMPVVQGLAGQWTQALFYHLQQPKKRPKPTSVKVF